MSVGDISVAPASTAPNLGVLFDPNLKFDLFLKYYVLFICLFVVAVFFLLVRIRSYI